MALLADGIDLEAVVAGLFLTHADNRIDEIAAAGGRDAPLKASRQNHLHKYHYKSYAKT